ncbi:MAG: Asp-tRNA(Asn)/Glu-tRNA(Gln) amidotransferase subunit GatC [Deltaproteobacteria bacterium]|nr:Asp-tRNA(Asn)/Glu-tRNA(Gln) amidotransferase subunit GatC [Deltaproteobacteria bacterium]
MSITDKDVKHVAGLARLNLSSEDTSLYTTQLKKILAHVEKLSEVNTEGVPPTTSTVPEARPMREDEAKPLRESLVGQECALENAPATKDGYFTVPKVIE